jgi:hypothetical protein
MGDGISISEPVTSVGIGTEPVTGDGIAFSPNPSPVSVFPSWVTVFCVKVVGRHSNHYTVKCLKEQKC